MLTGKQESSDAVLCNGERNISTSDNDSDRHERTIDSQVAPENDTVSSSDVSLNERLPSSSLGSDLDASVSRSSANHSSLLSGEVSSLSQLEDTDH